MFLNTDYNTYLLADTNPDLIGLYQQLLREGPPFIKYCRRFFTGKNNAGEQYYAYREEFNNTSARRRKSALFLYLNRHGYNGLCRYNSKGTFNTPFGRYTKPYFPEKEMLAFIARGKNVTLLQSSFDESMARARPGDVIYCDPPYTPLSDAACFTDYHVGGFNWDDQVLLTDAAKEATAGDIQVVISNHNISEIRDLYREAGAKIHRFKVQRSISCDGKKREKVGELLAVFNPG